MIRRGLHCLIPEVLDHLEKAQLELCECSVICLFSKYEKRGKLEGAVDLYFRMPKRRCDPSYHSLNQLLSILSKKYESVVLAKDVLMRSQEQIESWGQMEAFECTIKTLCTSRKLELAIEVFSMMKGFECGPDPKLYKWILSSICEEACGDLLIRLIDEMRNVGMLLSVKEYKKVIDALVKEARMDEAFNVLIRMRLEGKLIRTSYYNAVLDGFVSAANFPMVDEVFNEMLISGVVLYIDTYIVSLCKRGKFEEAFQMVCCMERVGPKLNIETFISIMAGFVEIGKISKMREVLSRVVEKGLRWSSRTYVVMIDGLLYEGSVLEACEMLMEMLNHGFAPGSSTFNALLCDLCRKGLLLDGIRIVRIDSKWSFE